MYWAHGNINIVRSEFMNHDDYRILFQLLLIVGAPRGYHLSHASGIESGITVIGD